MNFTQLSNILKQTNDSLYQKAVKAVNINISLRNWLFGYHIVEFEQNGEDRAAYGKQLLQNLAKELSIKGLTGPELSRCRQFYQTYPQMLGLITQESNFLLPREIHEVIYKSIENTEDKKILGTVSQEFENTTNSKILGTVSQESSGNTEYDKSYLLQILNSISFSHFVELIKIEDNLKRRFYELLILKTTPNVRELRRQIETLTFERLGLSSNYELAFEQIQRKIEPASNADLVKTHYFFEFLNISQPHLIEESELEQALIDHLQEFIIELGNGFCFEARQKRILIDDEYFFIDLVFYHRLLKCHVLVELKTVKAKYEHIGQLKAYLQFYKKNITAPDDNPPVGILLVTDKGEAMVEYAVAESDKEIFVSKYQLQLPDKKKLESFLRGELHKIAHHK